MINSIWDFTFGICCAFCALFFWSLLRIWSKQSPDPQAFEPDVERAVHIVRFDAGDVKSYRVIEEPSEHGLTMASVSIEMRDEGEA